MLKKTLLLAAASGLVPCRCWALESVLDSVDDLPEDVRKEYVERDGKWHLDVRGMKPESDFQRVQNALTAERRDHSALKTRIKDAFGERKFEDIQADLDRIPELEAAGTGKLDDAKINDLVEARVKTRLAPVERERDQLRAQLGEKDKTIEEMTGKEKRRAIRDAVRAAAKAAKVTDEALDDALLLGDNIFEIREDDGKIVVRDGTGYTQGIEPSVLFTDLQSKKPHWFGQSSGGGAGGNRGGGGGLANNPFTADNWNMTEQGRLMNSDPAKAEQLAKAAGHKDAATARQPAPKK